MAERYLSVVAASVAVYRLPAQHQPPLQAAEVLMLRRAPHVHHGGLWSLPAGHIKEGESLLTCAVRELWEEVGLRAKRSHYRLTNVHSSRDDNGDHRLSFLFWLHWWKGTPTLKEPYLHTEMAWVPLDAIPEDTGPLWRQWLRDVDGAMYTEGDC